MNSSFRVIKTMIVFLPFFFTNILKKEKYELSKYFDWFMQLNAFLVCIDFILFFLIGKTIMNFTSSGFMPRPCGLLEDSNFFSYLMLIYIYYYKWKYGVYKKIYIMSLLLSGSFSAIFFFFILLFLFRKKFTMHICSFQLKTTIVLISVIVVILYDCIAINPDALVETIYSYEVNDLLKVKLISMVSRLNTIANAMTEMDTISEYLLGIGAGKTRSLSEAGLNMHNSLLQLFLEMGSFLLFVVITIISFMIYYIKDTRWLILFCVMLVLGVMMETLYNPILSFIYYLSFTKQ